MKLRLVQQCGDGDVFFIPWTTNNNLQQCDPLQQHADSAINDLKQLLTDDPTSGVIFEYLSQCLLATVRPG